MGPASRRIPSLLLSARLRLLCLRLIVPTSLIEAGYYLWYVNAVVGALGIWMIVGHTVLVTVIAIHHVGTAFGPQLFPLPVWADIGLMVVETTWYLGVGWRLKGKETFYQVEAILREPVMALVAIGAVVLASGLHVLLILKALAIVNDWGTRPMRKRVDISLCGPLRPWWRYPAHSVFGVKLWEARIPGEPKALSILRGLLASIAILALASFGWYQAVVLPVEESGSTFRRQSRVGINSDFSDLFGEILYGAKGRLVLVWPNHLGATTHIGDAVTASTRWNWNATCFVEKHFSLTLDASDYGVASVTCPVPDSAHTLPENPQWFPNYDLTVDFTELLGSAKPGSAYNRDFDAVQVYVGLTGDVDEIVQNTEPLLLFPGRSILSVMRPVFLKKIKRQRLNILGFESLTTSMVAVMEQTMLDPFMDPPENRNISTLGLTRRSGPTEWYDCIQEYSSKSVIDGLSSIGGLGSLLSTVLLMLLGTSLYTALFREKPQSPFGLLHSVGPSQRIMADACDQKYPALRKDMQKEKEDAGVISLLLDTLIDIDSLRDHKEAQTGAGGNEGDTSSRTLQARDEEEPSTAPDSTDHRGREIG